MFHIEILQKSWLDAELDEQEDLCAHGKVRVVFDQRVVEAAGTISATALRLLQTLEEDHHITHTGEQMVPCCGYSMLANAAGDAVDIIGCDNGLDWEVVHAGDEIVITLADGYAIRISYAAYEKEVLSFADEVEAFYRQAKPKILPQDSIERQGYYAFWREWNRRRGRF